MGNKEYKKVKDIAREQVASVLNDKRALLTVTLIAVLQAFTLNPEKNILISSLSNGNSQSYYIERH
ncbi:MAG: hypothetical protein ABJB85_10570 [Nitrososphaerota archaeon]